MITSKCEVIKHKFSKRFGRHILKTKKILLKEIIEDLKADLILLFFLMHS